MNIHETIIFIHIYMSTHKYIQCHMYKYIYIYQHTNKIAHTHITNLPILLQHVCLGTLCPCTINSILCKLP